MGTLEYSSVGSSLTKQLKSRQVRLLNRYHLNMAKSLLPLSVSQESGDESVNEIISQLKSLLPFTPAPSSKSSYDQDALDIMQEAIFYIQDLNDILSESCRSQDSVPAS